MAGEHILIVDDNPQNLKLARVLLEAEGYRTSSAVDGHDALRAIEAARPDVILMDLQMPGIDGLTLTRRLKADPLLCAIVIIAVTAFAMRGDDLKALAAGCDGYVSKPIDISTLPDLIAAKLAARR